MNRLIEISGNVAAIAGIVISLAAGMFRLAGSYYVMGYEAITLFTGGIALMTMGCLAKLHTIAGLNKKSRY